MAIAASDDPVAGQDPGVPRRHRKLGAGGRLIELLARATAAGQIFVIRLLASPSRSATAFLVLTLALAPVALAPRDQQIYVGMASAVPTLYNYTIAIVVAAVVMAVTAPRLFRTALAAWVPFIAWVATLTLLDWSPTELHLSGLLQLGLGILAFAVGVVVERLDRRDSLVPLAFAAVAWGQLVAVGLAVAGMPLRTITGAQAIDIQGRATGLTAHPGELSKLLFFCGVCALVLPQRNQRERWLVWSTLGVVFLGVFLTQSRTILVAIIAMVGIYMLVEVVFGRWQRKHFAMLGLTVVLGLVSLPWLISRFAADPTGGARGHVAAVALDAISDHPVGVGPNGYVAVVGLVDRLTQTGVPVHNAFLLITAELGIAGGLAFWLPVGLVVFRSFGRTFRSRGRDVPARTVVAATPGIVLICMTGWGILQGPYFAIFLLVLGYFGARAGSVGELETAWTEVDTDARP